MVPDGDWGSVVEGDEGDVCVGLVMGGRMHDGSSWSVRGVCCGGRGLDCGCCHGNEITFVGFVSSMHSLSSVLTREIFGFIWYPIDKDLSKERDD